MFRRLRMSSSSTEASAIRNTRRPLAHHLLEPRDDRFWPIATGDALTANRRFWGIADMKRFFGARRSVANDPNRPLGHTLSCNGAILYRLRRPSHRQRPSCSRARCSRSKSDGVYGSNTLCRLRKPSISSRTSKPSTCFSSGLLRCPPRLLDRSPLHQKSGLSACGIGWRFSLK